MGAEPGSRSQDRVLSRRFLLVLALSFLAFASEYVLRPAIPLMIVERGGGSILVGIAAAAHALPSVLFRPSIGRLVDGWHHWRILLFGTVAATIAPLGVLVPTIAALLPVRFVQGFGWAGYIVSTHTLVAKLAPPQRRGEAAGYFEAMPALAALLVPGLGVGLYLAIGDLGPVLAASALGLIAVLITLVTPIPSDRSVALHDHDRSLTPRGRAFVEASALPATLMIATFMSAYGLFMNFPPLYAASVGAPVEALAIYYPAFGLVAFLSQMLSGRTSDLIGRGLAIRCGCAIAALGLVVAMFGSDLVAYAIGGGAYAIGLSLVAPATTAMTMDRAPVGKLGSAMATYSLGFQLAAGAGSVLWGFLIATAGFSLAFAAAIGLQAVTVIISLRHARPSSSAGRT